MLGAKGTEAPHERTCAATELGRQVLHAGRNLGVHVAHDESMRLQLPKLTCEDLLRNARHEALDLRESARDVEHVEENRQLPPTAQDLQRALTGLGRQLLDDARVAHLKVSNIPGCQWRNGRGPCSGRAMKAITFSRFGGPEVLTSTDVPTPAPGPGEALVRVHRAGVNFGDTVIRAGLVPLELQFPFVPGVEAAGVVEAIGVDVKSVAVGQRVAAPLFTSGRLDGGYAEAVAFDAQRLVPIPDDIGYEEAIALQLQGISAWRLLEHPSPEGRTVLVHASAGGTGSLLVQLAKLRGAARVLATASTQDKRHLAHDLGADDVFDYSQSSWTEKVLDATKGGGVDVIYDSVGGRIRNESFDVLASRGTLVIFGASSEANTARPSEGLDGSILQRLMFKRQSITGFLEPRFDDVALAGQTMSKLFDLVRRGVLRVIRGPVFRLEQAADAHRTLVSRDSVGKIFLSP
jgi:NADPH:quinone reductase